VVSSTKIPKYQTDLQHTSQLSPTPASLTIPTHFERNSRGHFVLDLTALSRHALSCASKGVPGILDGVMIEDVPKRGLMAI